MNRPIKFRAWNKEDNEMCFGYPMIEKEIYETFVEDITGSCFDVEYYGMELMQFTGLLDRNGKEIYESDVVEKLHEPSANYSNKRRFVVEYMKIYCGFGFNQIGYWEDKILINTNYKPQKSPDFHFGEIMEVIGNIYENPELLKEDSNS